MLNNDLPLDGFGACEGTLACCTCHVILSQEHFDRQDRTNPASEEELDLLDLAPDLSDLSRLGCQVRQFVIFLFQRKIIQYELQKIKYRIRANIIVFK